MIFDVSVMGALLAGLLSFLSPCILPMVPFYLSYLAGVSMAQIADGGSMTPAIRARAVLAATCFALGVITIFVGLGAAASSFGQLVRDWFDILRWIAAAVILAMGLHFLGVLRIGFLNRQFRADAGQTNNMSLIGAYVIGLAFAFGWTPCVGPVLAVILMTAGASESAAQGMWLLFFYGAGMMLPFIFAALFVAPFMRFMGRFRRHLHRVEQAMGVFLIIFAVLIGTNTINYIANWMLIYWPQIG